MRRFLTAAMAAALTGLLTGVATAETAFVTRAATVQVSGVRTAPNGENFFNIEGIALAENFRSYGVLRWDLTTAKANLDASHGAGNWTITDVRLRLTQSNISASESGALRAFYTADDATDISAGSAAPTYPFEEAGVPDLPVTLADPIATFGYAEGITGAVDEIDLFDTGNGGQRLAMRNDIMNAGDSSLTLVIQDVDPAVVATWRGQTSAGVVNAVELVLIATANSGNTPPVANAGLNVSVLDADTSGSESVTLDGSASFDSNGTIASYVWTQGVTTVGTGASPTINVTVAGSPHTYTLTVTDNNGATATDQVIVEVRSGEQPPVADATASFVVYDADQNGLEQVTLTGNGTPDIDSTIVAYQWSERGAVLGTSASLTTNLTVGVHTLRLRVTDDDALTDDDVVMVEVRPGNIVAGETFDGDFAADSMSQTVGPFGLASSGFQIYQRGVSLTIPFGTADDTLGIFLTDNNGIVHEKKLDAWWGVQDMLDNTVPPVNPSGTGSATFTFDISGETDLFVSIDIGACGDFEATGTFGDFNNWTWSIDGGTPAPLFTSSVDEAVNNTYTLASSRTSLLDDPMKIGTTVLDNELRTFTAAIPATGNTLSLTLNSRGDGTSEAYAFDSIFVTAGGGPPACPNPGCDNGGIDADFNNDCIVGLPDLSVLLANFGVSSGATNATGDTNTDGAVNLTDLSNLLSRFGANCN